MSTAKCFCLLASLALALAPADAESDPENPAVEPRPQSEAPSEAPSETQPPALELGAGGKAFDPDTRHTGALPLPLPAPGSGSPDIPQSTFFYVLPFIGLWLILRRRHRRVGL